MNRQERNCSSHQRIKGQFSNPVFDSALPGVAHDRPNGKGHDRHASSSGMRSEATDPLFQAKKERLASGRPKRIFLTVEDGMRGNV